MKDKKSPLESSSFSKAFKILSESKRNALEAYYEFAHGVDEIVDDNSKPLETKKEELAAWRKVKFGKPAVNYTFNAPRSMWIKSGKEISRDEQGGRENTPALKVANTSSALNIFALPGKGKRRVKVAGFYKGEALKLVVKWQSAKPAWLPEKFTASAVFPPAKEWSEFVLYATTPEIENVRIVPFISPARGKGEIIFDDFTVTLEETK